MECLSSSQKPLLGAPQGSNSVYPLVSRPDLTEPTSPSLRQNIARNCSVPPVAGKEKILIDCGDGARRESQVDVCHLGCNLADD